MFYYALQVATGKEKTFAENAKKMLPAETFPPHDFIFLTRELTIRRQGKYLKELQPLFPSYLFLSCEEEISGDFVHAIQSLPDCYHFLTRDKKVRPLANKDLAILQHFLTLGATARASLVTFDENDRIVVFEGPLKGLEGNIIKVDRRKKRAKIRVDFDNSQLTIDLSFDVMDKNKV